MNNITLVTSIINTSNNPLSYSITRSFWTTEQRFEQTKKTIESVKKYIHNSKVFIVECSLLTASQRQYFIENTDYFLNLYDLQDDTIINKIVYSHSKSMGEGTMTIYALKYIFDNNIDFINLFKISGRYWLNDKFNYSFYDNHYDIFSPINKDLTSVFTCIYKLSKNTTFEWLCFLKNCEEHFENCVGFENLFGIFLISMIVKYKSETFNLQYKDNYNYNKENNYIKNPIGLNGYLSISNEFIDC